MLRLSDRKSLAAHIEAPGQRNFANDERGSIVVFVVVVFALLVAFVGLSVDVGRIMNIHSQANSYADRVALAAATELDKTNSSLTRAVTAAVGQGGVAGLVDPGVRFSLSGDSAVGISKLTFMSALGPDPQDPYARSPVAGDVVVAEWTPGGGFTYPNGFDAASAATSANFVLATTTTETENYVLFPIASWLVPGVATQASVAPQAVAGYKQSVCNFPPVTICNPYENTTAPYGGPFNAIIGQQIKMQGIGPGTSWTPGGFGFLQTPAGSGAPHCNSPPGQTGDISGAAYLRCILALVQPNTRCVDSGVSIRPGQVETANVGLNVMFDIYDAPLQNKKTDPAFGPSANVTTGWNSTSNCRLANQTPSVTNTPLPRDPCLITDTCSPNARFGDGVTNAQLNAYWQATHGANLPAAISGATTRYEVYRHEMDINQIPEGPVCAPVANGVNNPIRDRRVMIGAIINCLEQGITGAATDVPVIAYGEFFITEEIGDPGTAGNAGSAMYAEVIGVVEPTSNNSVVRTYPVLHR